MSASESNATSAPEGQVDAVIIPCEGEGGPSINTLPIPLTHQCFDLPPTPISAIVQFPVVVYKTNSLPPSTPRQQLDNQIATMLMANPDTGFAPPEWQSRVGTCIVARKDKKPLDRRHFEGLWMYINALYGEGGARSPAELRARGAKPKDRFEWWFKGYVRETRDVREAFHEVNKKEGEEWKNEWEDVPPLF